MNWSLFIIGLVALSGAAIAENSYLVMVPKLIKVGCDNQLSIFIGSVPQPVDVKFELNFGQKRVQCSTTVKPGQTSNATLTLPKEFPIGPAELTILGTGGVRFEEKRDVIVYDNSYVVLVQTSASTYRPGDMMDIRVVVTNEELMPIEKSEMRLEIYDANLKLVGEFSKVPVVAGLTDTLSFPISEHCNIGSWVVSAMIGNTTSSIEILIAKPITPSFDFKAIFQRFLLRTDKTLRGFIEIDDDKNEPIFGRAFIAVGQINEQDVEQMMKQKQETSSKPQTEEWRTWKSQQMEIAGRLEINYDLMSMFNIDVTKAIAVQVYIKVTELSTGDERVIQHVIPIFTRDVIYDIRPLEFEIGCKNEFEIIAKRPDGKPAKMEDLILTLTMMMGNEEGKVKEEKSIEITEFYTRGRTDIGLFNVEIPENCIGLLMTITPLGEDGKARGYRTHAVPLMPKPRRGATGAKLSIELLPSTTGPISTEPNTPVVSTQISTVGQTSNFYIQLIPSKPVEKFEELPMSYVVLTNGRIVRSGEFLVRPTMECQTKTQRSIKPEEPSMPTCVFNGTLPIEISREMRPYSILLVYTLQPTFGYHVAESYRFCVGGLFPNKLTLEATTVPYTSTSTMFEDDDSNSLEDFDSLENMEIKSVPVSARAQGKSRVQLSFTGTPGSTVGLNVFEFDGVLRGLSNEVSKERVLQYLTRYEQVPIVGMPTSTTPVGELPDIHKRSSVPTTGNHESMNMKVEKTPVLSSPGSKKRNLDENKPMTGDKSGMKRMSVVTEDEMNNKQGTVAPDMMVRRAIYSEETEEKNMERERMAYKVRYPIENMIFGLPSSRGAEQLEGDDAYTKSTMGRLYGEMPDQRTSTHYRRRGMKSLNQFDVTVAENDYVMTVSSPMLMTQQGSEMKKPTMKSEQDDMEIGQPGDRTDGRNSSPRYGSQEWYETMNSKLSVISQEAFKFMQSGLAIVSDFSSLRLPADMRRTNLAKMFSQFRQTPRMGEDKWFDARDQARVLLEDYLVETDLTMVPPPFMLEEQARNNYYRSTFFNTSRIESQGTGKVVLPLLKPYSTWLATGFSLHEKSGLSLAEPILLPPNQGLFILGNFPDQVQVGEHILLSYGINNYLGKDLTNIIVRIRASADFDLIEQNQPERIASTNGKDYTITIPTLKTSGVETRNIVLVPKRSGVVKILLEVECEFGGDFEVLTTYVRESGIERKVNVARLYDLTSEKKTYGPIVEKITPSPFLRSVRLSVSGTGLDRLVERYTSETNTLVGIDRAIIRLWRSLGLMRYLNETSQMESPLFDINMDNITTAYQKLQFYSSYDGSFSFISDQGEQKSSLYLTTLAFGAMISPFMPVRDYVMMNRTLSWILSRQQQDGSFDDEGVCFHYRFCSGEYRRESLTALVLYTMTRHGVSEFVPEFIRERLYIGEQCPIVRAQRYLESRLETVKPCLLTTTLLELALIQCPTLPEPMRQKIYENIRTRQLTVVPEDNSRFLKINNDKMTFDEEILLNSLTLSVYARMGDLKTTSDIARWIVRQLQTHLHYDTVLDGVFRTDAWLMTDILFRKRFGTDKFSVVIDVTADNGQKQQFKIDSSNMDMTRYLFFTMPVNQITYTVSGFGFACVNVRQTYREKQLTTTEPTPFKLTSEFTPMPWFNEITTKTCVTYTPTPRDTKLVKDTFNRTIVVEFQLPSGMRVDLRQIGFFLSRVPEAMYFTFDERANKINFFLNVPSTVYGKPICFEWCLDRLSFVTSWTPIQIRVYDYLQQEFPMIQLVPIQFQPNLLGYSFVEAVHKARPTPEQLMKMQSKPNRA